MTIEQIIAKIPTDKLAELDLMLDIENKHDTDLVVIWHMDEIFQTPQRQFIDSLGLDGKYQDDFTFIVEAK